MKIKDVIECMLVPIKSGITRPSENAPDGYLKKDSPYGGKLA